MKEKIFRLIKNILAFITFYKSKNILIMPDGVRFGNHLYYLLNCYTQKNTYVLEHPHLEKWLEIFPMLKTLVVEKKKINLLDFKKKDYNFHQKYGEDFSPIDLHNFIKEKINPNFNTQSYTNSDDKLTIHIRIGDYYSNKANEDKYGYSQINYLKYIITSEKYFSFFNNISEIVIISDNQKWCKENLDFLKTKVTKVTISDEFNDPYISFLSICSSKNLIITNSTFSYWGAYISNFLFNNEDRVIAPEFHSRQTMQAYQLNKKWNIVTHQEFDFCS